ncbi:MAG TPA: cytochrome P450, partial [Ktedonobacteraceae bacterium]
MGNTPESRAAWFRHMQEMEPVCFHPEYELWEIFRYEDIQHVLFDYANFSTEYVRLQGLPDVDDLGNTDPPRHRELRTIVSKAFTPRSIERLVPRILARVDALLDKATVEGRMDVAAQLAFPLPVLTIAELLGVPPEDQDRFRRWSYQLMGALPNPDDPNYHELTGYFREMLDRRARDPQDDLMSALLAAESNGQHLTRDEVVSLSVTLLLAGHITTTMMINRAFYRFDKQPEIFAALRADPGLIPGAIEEVLRYEFSMSNLLRLVRRDTALAGHQLKE